MTLRAKLVRLAYERPDLRDDLLPLVKEAKGMTVNETQRNEWARRYERAKAGPSFLAVDPGSIVGVHLNRHRKPFFSIRYPAARRGGTIGTGRVVGYSSRIELTGCFFVVGIGGTKSVAMGGKPRSVYAGVVGKLTGVELPEGSEGTPAFGSVAKGSEVISFNPFAFPAWRSMFLCRKGSSGKYDVPVVEASKVTLYEWGGAVSSGTYAQGVKDMSASEIEATLNTFGLTPADLTAEDGGRAVKKASETTLREQTLNVIWNDPSLGGVLFPLLKG
jgi:hypothetical protein